MANGGNSSGDSVRNIYEGKREERKKVYVCVSIYMYFSARARVYVWGRKIESKVEEVCGGTARALIGSRID